MPSEPIALAVTADNGLIFREFYDAILSCLSSLEGGVRRHLDIGHGKILKFPFALAHTNKGTQVTYYDNADFISRLRQRWELRKQKLPENLVITSNPEPGFDSASYYLTIHEFAKPVESLHETHRLLGQGGVVCVVDYDLDWVKFTDNPEEVMRGIFNAKNERRVAEEEKDWIKAHTSYSLEGCVRDAEAVGFKTLDRKSRNNKFFLYVGEK